MDAPCVLASTTGTRKVVARTTDSRLVVVKYALRVVATEALLAEAESAAAKVEVEVEDSLAQRLAAFAFHTIRFPFLR